MQIVAVSDLVLAQAHNLTVPLICNRRSHKPIAIRVPGLNIRPQRNSIFAIMPLSSWFSR